MVRPPAVTWDVKPGRWHGGILVLLLLAAALLLLGFVGAQGWGVASVVLLAAFALASLLALHALRTAPAGKLNWDGERWHWSGWEESEVTALVCALDLHRTLLVHLTGKSGASQWLWLECRAPGHQWTALRRALVVACSAAKPKPVVDVHSDPANLRS